MLYEKIQAVHVVLGTILGKVDVETAEILRLCRRNLMTVAEQVKSLEENSIVVNKAAYAGEGKESAA